jgi:PEP-CTERM motif
MKAVLLFCVMIICWPTGVLRAQGIVTFIAGSANPIQYSLDGGGTVNNWPLGSPSTLPGYGKLNIALYAASSGTVLNHTSAGTPNLSGWMIASPVMHDIVALPGRVAATAVITDASLGAPGSSVALEVVGWTGNFNTFEDAFGSGGSILAWSGSSANGGAFGWTQPTGSSTVPQPIFTGSIGFNGLLFVAPEPGTVALGGLGTLLLAFFRWQRGRRPDPTKEG